MGHCECLFELPSALQRRRWNIGGGGDLLEQRQGILRGEAVAGEKRRISGRGCHCRALVWGTAREGGRATVWK